MSNYSWQDDNDTSTQNTYDPSGDDPGTSPKPDQTDHGRTAGNPQDYGQYGYGSGGSDSQNSGQYGYGSGGSNSQNSGQYGYGSAPDNSQNYGHYDYQPNRQYFDLNTQKQGNYGQNPRYTQPGSSGMATAALILGICSLLFICCGLSPLVGGVGIVIALLSRGNGKMESSAQIGLGLSIGGIVIGILSWTMLLIYSFQSVGQTDLNNFFDDPYMEDFFDDSYDYDMDDYDDLREYFSDIDL